MLNIASRRYCLLHHARAFHGRRLVVNALPVMRSSRALRSVSVGSRLQQYPRSPVQQAFGPRYQYQYYRTLESRGVVALSLAAFLLTCIGGYSTINTAQAEQPVSSSSSSSSPESTASTTPLRITKPPRHDTSPENIQGAVTEFIEILGQANVMTDKEIMKSYAGSDWSSYVPKENDMPAIVLTPGSTEDVSRIMKVCHKRVIPVTAYSGGTSLEGHFAATRGGVSIDFQRMDQIVALHKDDLDVVVQPAVEWEALNEELAQQDGLFFPPDPGRGAEIGGMVATGCSGTNAYYYGTMREWVLSLTVVLADGTVIKTRQRPRKSSAGYDLTRTFIGNEGTLSLVTEATLKLTNNPGNQTVAVASFPTIHDAADCASAVVRKGVHVAAVELLDDVQMESINLSRLTSHPFDESPTLFFKFSGTPSGTQEQISSIKSLAERAKVKTFQLARNPDEVDQLWGARKSALNSIVERKKYPSDRVWTTDVAVPISRLPDIIEETKDDINKSGVVAGIAGHVGDGNFHAFLVFRNEEQKIAEELVHRMVKRAIRMEGTCTGEHGVGLVKRDYLPHEVGESTVDAMRKMKQAFDPLCLLNCDKVIRMQVPKPGEVSEW